MLCFIYVRTFFCKKVLSLQVGRIRDIKAQGKSGQISVQVAWFYRPEEATGGRKVRGLGT